MSREQGMAVERDEAVPDGPWRSVSPRQRWATAILMTMLFVLSFVDRNIIKLLVDPIRHDLGATDLQISLLVGLSFSMLYSVSCVPFGYASDIVSRRKLLAGAVAVWSTMSVLCGVASSYAQLFVARAGLGIGEAALQPSATSLIRDSFPPKARARPFSVFAIGPLVGSAMAMLIGGALFGLAEAGHVRDIPILGALRPWQFALVIPGLIGLVLAAAVLLIAEPARPPKAAGPTPGFRETWRHIRAHGGLYLLVFAAPTIWSLGNSGWTAWMAPAMGRRWGLSPVEIGATAGLIALSCASIGTIGWGFLIDALTARGKRDAIIQVPVLVIGLHLVPALAIFLMPTITGMWVAYGFSMLLTGPIQIAASTIIAERTPSHLIGKTIALFNMVQNFLGLAIGPTLFALVASGFFPGERGIIPAMMICYPLAMLASAAIIWRLRRVLRETTAPRT